MRVLVTGASGFIGGRLLQGLITEGHAPVAMVRRSSDTTRIDELGVTKVTGDLRDPASLREAVRDVDAVVHLAAYYNFYGEKHLYHELNVKATQNLAKAAKEAGVEHFIYCSSTEAMGPAEPPGDENSTPDPRFEYGRSKLEAERRLRQLEGEEPWVTVIRPSGVYGPGNVDDVSYWFIMSLARNSPLSWFIAGSGESLIQFVHVSDVVQGILLALGNPASRGETYIVTCEKAYTYNMVYGIIAGILGRKPPRLHVPAALAKLMVTPVELINRLLGADSFLWHAATVDSVTCDRAYSSEKAAAELGYKPRYTLEQGLRETVDWYRENGFI